MYSDGGKEDVHETLLAVRKQFSTFDEAEKAISELKEKESHPLRVFNSQKVEDFNRKQDKLKIQVWADASKFKYTCYSVRYSHYGA